MESTQTRTLLEWAALALRLGMTAFGGPAVHMSMMEEEVVPRRGWLTRADFLDFLGATNLIPGPNQPRWPFTWAGCEPGGPACWWRA